MLLHNKGKRSFTYGKNLVLHANKHAEVEKADADKLVKMYPSEIYVVEEVKEVKAKELKAPKNAKASN